MPKIKVTPTPAAKTKSKPTPKPKAAARSKPKAEPSPKLKLVKPRVAPTTQPKRPKPIAPPKIQIFQTVRSAAEKAAVDASATALLLSGRKASLYGHLSALVEKQAARAPVGVWGILPADFSQKSGVAITAMLKAVESNPGRDVYLINPNPAEEAIFPNPLSRLLVEFPNAGAIVASLLESGLQKKIDPNVISASAGFSMAPMMVASSAFWQAFWSYASVRITELELNLKKERWGLDEQWLHTPVKASSALAGDSPATYLLGGLIGPFLSSESGRHFKALKIAIPAKEAGLNSHLKSLRQLKDAAVKSKSAWLASCWLNYRNLYVYQVNGKEWCKTHLRAITPKTAEFL